MNPLDIFSTERDDLGSWFAEHHRSVEVISELLTVLALLAFVAGLIGGAWLFAEWWTA